MREFIPTRRIGLGFAALIVIFPAGSRAQEGIRLFRKMQSALGGRDKIAAIQDLEQCVRADAWDDEGNAHGEVYKRTRWIRPNVLRLDQVGPGDGYVLYFNGVAGWEILPDKGLSLRLFSTLLKMPVFGEEKAHTCAIACYRQSSSLQNNKRLPKDVGALFLD